MRRWLQSSGARSHGDDDQQDGDHRRAAHGSRTQPRHREQDRWQHPMNNIHCNKIAGESRDRQPPFICFLRCSPRIGKGKSRFPSYVAVQASRDRQQDRWQCKWQHPWFEFLCFYLLVEFLRQQEAFICLMYMHV
uniref:Uncharacterized protein n=1 Tax=Zea mays TaxID=4577 RepID=A0A804QAZ4_MAIZE